MGLVGSLAGTPMTCMAGAFAARRCIVCSATFVPRVAFVS